MGSEMCIRDSSIIAFHLYQKWIKLKNGYQVYAQVQACERKNQQGLFYAGYNLKALDKKRTIFDNMVLGVATPSHQNGNSDSTTLANAQATTTLGKKSTTQFDKLQDDTSNHVLPLLILMIKDEMGRVVFDLENGIDEIDDRLAFQAIQSPVFVREGLKPTNKDGKVTASARQKANNEAIALLDKIESEGLTRDDLTAEQLETLAKYTGNGGGIVNHEGKTGSQYEYYTPMELASSMWDLARELGFNGGKVLDPSAGTGVFTATSPDNAIIDSVELDRVSGGIAKVLNDGSRSHTVVAPFEQEANRIDDNSMDMVITNVPFGKNSDRGANKKLDKAYQDESLENYFILRSLEKLKHGGLAVFVTPTSIVSGKQQANIKLRQKASLKAEFLGAYRLPNSMFAETGADVVTDVIAFRKYSEDATNTIKDLYDGGSLDTLTQAGVLWDDFINCLLYTSDAADE